MRILAAIHALAVFIVSDGYQILDSIIGIVTILLLGIYIHLLLKRIRLLEEILQTHIVMDQTMMERLLDKKCEKELQKQWRKDHPNG